MIGTIVFFGNRFDQYPNPHIYVHVQPRFHNSANDNTVKFIRENKSPEGKSVEILAFGVYENPLLLRKVHMIDGTMLIMFLDRRNSENC